MSGGKEPKFEATADSDIGPWVQLATTSYNKQWPIVAWAKKAGVFKLVRSRPSSDEFVAFPCPLSHAVVADIIHAWLEAIEYPDAPRTDGSVKKGWTIRTTLIGFEVEPAWVVYGK